MTLSSADTTVHSASRTCRDLYASTSHGASKSNVASCTFMIPSGRVAAELGAITSGPQQQRIEISARARTNCFACSLKQPNPVDAIGRAR